MRNMRLALGMGLAALLALAGCGDDDGPGTDAGGDVGTTDTGGTDTGGTDTGGTDTGGADTGGTDGGGTACDTDADCTAGEEWCVGGECVECDNGGLVCDIACAFGWETYERNGCFPCACAPTNQCTSDGDCDGGTCYAGAFCWDWCPAGEPSCCFGNVCSGNGCPGPNPVGCITRGCPEGAECQDFSAGGECVSSNCGCSGGSWVCTDDCGGGSCAFPL